MHAGSWFPVETTGNAVMIGDDPLHLKIKKTSRPQKAQTYTYGGRYPCGSLVHNGVWYYGTYCLGITKTTIEDGYHYGWPTIKFMDTYLLESDHVEGPWKLFTYMEHFGEQGYFVNIPSKFISPDGYTSWLSYSGNFATFKDLKVNPPGGRYGFILQEMKLLTRAEYLDFPEDEIQSKLSEEIKKWEDENPLTCHSNLARQAKVRTSSVAPDYSADAVIDGVVDGYPNNPQHEWASKGQTVNAKIHLTWNRKIKVSKIWLFDRPSHNEHIIRGGILMSDGTTLYIGELPNAGLRGKDISFPTKEVEWVEFVVLGVGRSKDIGLAEIDPWPATQ